MKNRLKELRKEKGMSRYELAEQLGVTYRTIQRWEKEERPIRIINALNLSIFFDVSTSYLLGLSDERNATEKQKRTYALIIDGKTLLVNEEDSAIDLIEKLNAKTSLNLQISEVLI